MKLIVIGSLVPINLRVQSDPQCANMGKKQKTRQSEEKLNLEKEGVIKPILLMGELRHRSRK